MRSLHVLFFVIILSCSQANLHAQNCTLTCPAPLVVKADNGTEGAIVNFPVMTAPAECGTLTYTPSSGTFFRLGSHSVIITTSAGQKCSFTVTVTDNEPPSLSSLTLSRSTLWPASNKLKKVSVNYTTSDNTGNVKTEIAVTSNTTDGVKDWEILDDRLVRLKASRLTDGSPRVYLITVTATDEAGNKTSRTTSIAVSKTMVAKK
ncbi:MAG: hypothetical protein ABIT05_06090 [Chitinophagaceae bacterium]